MPSEKPWEIELKRFELDSTRIINKLYEEAMFLGDYNGVIVLEDSKNKPEKGPITKILEAISGLFDAILTRITDFFTGKRDQDLPDKDVEIDYDFNKINSNVDSCIKEAKDISNKIYAGQKVPEGRTNKLLTKMYNILPQKAKRFVSQKMVLPAIRKNAIQAKKDIKSILSNEMSRSSDSIIGEGKKQLADICGGLKHLGLNIASVYNEQLSRIIK